MKILKTGTKMGINKDTVKLSAKLARIELSQEEASGLAIQLEGIVNFIDTLKKADINQIPPTSHILPLNNVLRSDTVKESLPIDEALLNAPETEEKFFKVAKIIE
ncbi:MAG: Asp-tRNA(Asn)/Glu-tRNA(Gln) amidotransferase subunit GatC [Candidatus Omnitrophica bacterium]|jgi:aspartyl-tRNA(Asn)/glutamyl-tRNA(Gln) amidotransferase subunit C|nr:Asp-tRNA(Asn)/Glu-tRNA(Gln) amidotransferase subunit GatC [Candidatus Omnitrophota bacterium]